jgi:hypothetical protein
VLAEATAAGAVTMGFLEKIWFQFEMTAVAITPANPISATAI